MAWKRNRRKSDDVDPSDEVVPSNAIDLFVSSGGILVEGAPHVVEAFVAHMLPEIDAANRGTRHLAVDGAQIAANLLAVGQLKRQYFEFAPKALQRLSEFGAIPTRDGFFRSFVRDGQLFAGNLDWKPVAMGPERALGLQLVATQMALRAAVKEVKTAIAQVEHKVDQLAKMARAERLGAAVADYRTLEPLVERVRTTGKLSSTDWTTVATLGPLIARDIEALRAFIWQQLDDVRSGFTVRSRLSEAQALREGRLREFFALLALAEKNYVLWQELRLAHAENHEPAANKNILSDVRQQLDSQKESDQRLLEALRETIGQLMSPTGYEGFAPTKRHRLAAEAAKLDETCKSFQYQRNLDGETVERPELPNGVQSLKTVRDQIVEITRKRHTEPSDDPKPGLTQ